MEDSNIVLDENNAQEVSEKLRDLLLRKNIVAFREIYGQKKKKIRAVLFDIQEEKDFVTAGNTIIASPIETVSSQVYLRPRDVSSPNPESGSWDGTSSDSKKVLIKIGDLSGFVSLKEGDVIAFKNEYVLLLHSHPTNKDEKSYQVFYLRNKMYELLRGVK